MIRGGKGGASTQTGLRFEGTQDLAAAINRVHGLEVRGGKIYRGASAVGELLPKHKLYTGLLLPKGVKWETLISQKLLPDQVIYMPADRTIFIVEIKYQATPGSVDEKLQTCDYKKKQYRKLLDPLGLKVEYVYVLNDWFLHKRYKDVLNYIEAAGCRYFFNEIPLNFLGLAGSPAGRQRA